jgi:hypothetical protein
MGSGEWQRNSGGIRSSNAKRAQQVKEFVEEVRDRNDGED